MDSGANIRQAILTARRLLSEHVDVLQMVHHEETQRHSNAVIRPTSTASSCVVNLAKSTIFAVVSISSVAVSVNKILSMPTAATIIICATSSACTLYSLRQLRIQLQHHSQLQHIAHLLNRVEAFDNTLRQKIKYFREVKCLAVGRAANDQNYERSRREESTDDEIKATIVAALPVIRATYVALQSLETLPLAPEIDALYMPTESLDGCEMFAPEAENVSFQQYGVHNIRDVAEIFQLLQSQLLLRLGLATVYSTSDAASFVARQVPALSSNIDAQLRLLAGAERTRARRQEVAERLEEAHLVAKSQHDDGDALAMAALRHVTVDVLGRMLAISEEMCEVNVALHRLTDVRDAQILAVVADVHRLGERLDVLGHEFRRMVCTFNRAVHGRMETTASEADLGFQYSVSCAVDAKDDAEPSPAVRLFDYNNDKTAPDAEFYALAERNDGDASDSDTASDAQDTQSLDTEMLELNEKIVKSQFRPVLRQLRDRLEPINDAMRQRERQFLAEKGIPMTDEDDRRLSESDSDDDESNDKGNSIRKDNYADMRQFMMDNKSMGFMPLLKGLPIQHRGAMLEEEILE